MTARLTTSEVCKLARYSSGTLWRRIDAGHMPKPLDRCGKGYLFDEKAVHIALGMYDHEVQADQTDWDFDPVAYREALARRIRRDKGQGWRDRPRVLPSPGEAPSLRLVASNPTPH